jgi:tRNA pseudouridine55 synthase
LPICLGAATKVSAYLLEARKTYAVVAALGAATDTGDADGEVVERSDAAPPSAAAVLEALASFHGDSEQIPPMYSALKRGGRPLYELARRGIEVERAPRRVRIHVLELDAYDWPELRFTVTCSKGTYVRTLVADIAAALGTLGYVTGLRRLSVAPFAERGMVDFDTLDRAAGAGVPALDALLLPVETPLLGWPCIDLDAERATRLSRGQRVSAEAGWPRGLVRLTAPGAGFFGVGEVSAEGELVSRRLFLG